ARLRARRVPGPIRGLRKAPRAGLRAAPRDREALLRRLPVDPPRGRGRRAADAPEPRAVRPDAALLLPRLAAGPGRLLQEPPGHMAGLGVTGGDASAMNTIPRYPDFESAYLDQLERVYKEPQSYQRPRGEPEPQEPTVESTP